MTNLNDLLNSKNFGEHHLKTDSREVVPGDIFIAIKGPDCDGHDYIKDAALKGAAYMVCSSVPRGLEEKYEERIVRVDDTLEAVTLLSEKYFNDPSSKLKVYGVTGTNGKTTTVFLLDSILNSAGIKSGFISTVFSKSIGEKLEKSCLTTPGILRVNRLFSEMMSDNKQAAVLEVSSHALDQGRVSGIKMESAVFTNISPEHLDYHKNMDNYLEAKLKIFKNLKEEGIAVINADDPLLEKAIEGLKNKNVITFGIENNAFVKAENILLSAEGIEFDLVVEKVGKEHISSSLIGRHNVYNMLAATGALFKSGLDISQIKEGLEKARPVPGRLERVLSTAPFSVFVDYAHTPDALENVLKCLKGLVTGRLICVFGCGGNRDKSKRPVMGEKATRICDEVFITSDNPRKEKPEDIIREIEKGVLGKTNYSIIEDRRRAIHSALRVATEGDIVVIAGKGHEDYQIIGNEVLHFDDTEVALEGIQELGFKTK